MIVESDPYLVLKYCALANISYLFILQQYTSYFDFYPALDAIRGCSWDDFTSDGETNTALEIYFPELTFSVHYNLILEITGMVKYGIINGYIYKARHAHKRLCMVLPKYSKIQVLPDITSCRLMKDNNQQLI